VLYIAKINNKICSPIDKNTLKAWAESGRISHDTQISPQMLQNWKQASEYDFLSNVFNKNPISNDILLKTQLSTNLQVIGDIKKASCKMRLISGIVDIFMIILITTAVSFILILATHENYEFIYKCFITLSLFFILLYLSVCLGFLGQTAGMWFTGIIILDKSYENVLPLQGFKAAIFMLIFGIISPLTYYVIGNKRTLHDLLSKTQIIYSSKKH